MYELENNSYICIMKTRMGILVPCILLLMLTPSTACARGHADSLTLQRVLAYRQCMPIGTTGVHTNLYVRYYLKTDKRNFTLMAIPSMYAIARGNREFAGESYSTVYIKDNGEIDAVRQLNTGTVPRHKDIMTTLNKYLLPDIYGVTIIDNQLLSPFNRHNVGLYRYDITNLTGNRAEIVFRPRRYNTQLVSGWAIVDRGTGRVIKISFNGEYDMVNFHITAEMGKAGVRSLMPKTCDIDASFHFVGNKIRASFHSVYDNPVFLPDTIVNSHDEKMMARVRPAPLPTEIKKLYARHDSVRSNADTTRLKKEDSMWKKILWNSFGDYVINRTKGNFGSDRQGAFRISPILNPLYLGYSGRRGITYKFKINGSYKFSLNSDIYMAFNAGYSFKQKQLYFKIPIRYNYNKKRNGYIGIEIGNGNRITNSSIVDQVKHESLDSLDWDNMNLDYFKDLYVKFVTNYDISDKWSVQPGLVFHRRSAVDEAGFNIASRPVSYYSLAPTMQVQFRPSGWDGPIITADYERGIHAGKADMEYERFEFDVSWVKRFYSLRSLSLRLGNGFYTSKSKNSYFLDYSNFRDENIPGGWDDDWTGEFQMLNSNWYNVSEYYARANVTYESPLMILSRIPYVGRLMEMERIYMNVLFVEHLHPYIEYGYGFTNRFFSMGVFMATRNEKFEGFGCRFGFELFRDW